MRPYVVRQGEYLSLLGTRHGFDAEAVWGAPENADLRALRSSPEVLAPGDILHLPEGAALGAELHSRAANRYRASVPTIPVRVQLCSGDRALSNARCLVHVRTPPIEVRTGGDGVLAFDAPMNAHEVRVELPDEELTLRVLVGHLDPPNEESGVVDRLANLGLLSAADRRAPEEQRRARTREALTVFQERRGMAPTGELDAATRDALRDEHGV